VFRKEVLKGIEIKSTGSDSSRNYAKIAKHKWRVYEVPIITRGARTKKARNHVERRRAGAVVHRPV